jgi:ABC-type hemin transport system substrate-binding protein
MRGAVTGALLLLLAACTPAAPKPAPAASLPVADMISLSPAITETVALLGADNRLKGRSDWCNEPASVRALPAFGTSLTPALERIASARPARLLIDGSLGNQRDQLEALAPVEVLPWLTVEEVMESTRRIGRLVDRDAAAAQLAERFRPWLRPLPAEAQAVLLLIGDDGPETGTFWFVKEGSLHGAMLRAAGWRNAVAEPVATPSLSAEALLRLDPEAIVVLVAKPDAEADRRGLEEAFAKFGGLRAVRSRRLALLADPNILSTGPSLLATSERLSALLTQWQAQ